MNLIELDDIAKTFKTTGLFRRHQPTPAVDGLSLAIPQGSTVGVVGESGSGKSTLGRIALRLIEPDSGTVRFDGEDLGSLTRRRLRARRRDMQMIFQDPFDSLDKTMTIGDLVGEPLLVHRMVGNRASLRDQVAEMLMRVGLRDDQMDRYPFEFSGGQLQRVAIARALATRPRFVVCDEPVASLDVSIRAQVINLLDQLQQELGLTYMFISHDLSLIRLIATEVAVMYRGHIVESGPTDKVYERPDHPYTRSLLEAIPARDPSRRHLVKWSDTDPGEQLASSRREEHTHTRAR